MKVALPPSSCDTSTGTSDVLRPNHLGPVLLLRFALRELLLRWMMLRPGLLSFSPEALALGRLYSSVETLGAGGYQFVTGWGTLPAEPAMLPTVLPAGLERALLGLNDASLSALSFAW